MAAEDDGRRDHHRGIGESLLSARLAAGLTVRQVSDRTRITVEGLRRVEAGDFAQCGGDIYARGHIRAYAQAVGLDPEALLAGFGAVRLPPLTKRDLRKPRVAQPPTGRKAVPDPAPGQRRAAARRARSVLPSIVPGSVPSLVPMVGATPPPELPPLKQQRRADFTDADAGSAAALDTGAALVAGSGEPAVNRRPTAFMAGAKSVGAGGPNWTLALAGAVTAVGLVAALQLWPAAAAKSRAAGTSAATAATADKIPVRAAPQPSVVPVAVAAPSAGGPAAAPTSTAPVPPTPPAAVDVKVVGGRTASWLGITNSAGQELYWNVLQPGQTKEFTDSSRLDVIVGNASAVDLTVNGHDLGPQGGAGEVFRGSYGKSS